MSAVFFLLSQLITSPLIGLVHSVALLFLSSLFWSLSVALIQISIDAITDSQLVLFSFYVINLFFITRLRLRLSSEIMWKMFYCLNRTLTHPLSPAPPRLNLRFLWTTDGQMEDVDWLNRTKNMLHFVHVHYYAKKWATLRQTARKFDSLSISLLWTVHVSYKVRDVNDV